ncbi:AraC family transcriptional regulator [Leuconostoc litchii]|uniref:AraC family transcriptional regulator n=1 Tax=Leuconostoc litchii TaxID=1981069 RepID=A0A6P2CMG9_9LACO|nr:AraC family transcriptional regulator [Leuconostoc litchii]TYC46774.1 AraC family transcriptional regulator [Leuconostoc litchii]GMA70660.1 AraC family transcriptional regulator [Leuconostoc litchii]
MEKSLFNIITQHTFQSSICFDFAGVSKTFASHSSGPLKRSNYLIHIVLAGHGTYFTSNQKYTLSAGDFFLVRPNETIFYQADLNDPWHYAWISIGGDETTQLIEHFSPFKNNRYIFSCSNIKQYLQLIIKTLTLTDQKPKSELQLNQISSTFLELLMDENGLEVNSSRQEISHQLMSEYTKLALTYINNNFTYNTSINDIATAIKINRSYFSRLFQRDLGISPKQFLLRMRINEACQLLQTTQLSINQIAEKVGFSNASIFGHSFTQFIHETPSAYRKRRRFNNISKQYPLEWHQIDDILGGLNPVQQST